MEITAGDGPELCCDPQGRTPPPRGCSAPHPRDGKWEHKESSPAAIPSPGSCSHIPSRHRFRPMAACPRVSPPQVRASSSPLFLRTSICFSSNCRAQCLTALIPLDFSSFRARFIHHHHHLHGAGRQRTWGHTALPPALIPTINKCRFGAARRD